VKFRPHRSGHGPGLAGIVQQNPGMMDRAAVTFPVSDSG
jgi:hypothetical protein